MSAPNSEATFNALKTDLEAAAQALVKTQLYEVSNSKEVILAEFQKRFCDTELFYDKYAGGKFADYLFKAKETLERRNGMQQEGALRLLQEAQLFIDAAHSCYNKLSASKVAIPAGGEAANRSGG